MGRSLPAQPEGITNPPIDDLLAVAGSKYELVTEAAQRARQINAYYAQLQEGLLENVGPLVTPEPNEKPLSIALREINEGKIVARQLSEEDFGAGEEITLGEAPAAVDGAIDFSDQ